MEFSKPRYFKCILALFLFVIASSGITKAENPYNIKHYELYIEPDFMNKTISLSASIEIENPQLADTFAFGLNDSYEISNVAANVSSVTFNRNEGEISVTVKKPAKELTLTFKLKGKPGKSTDENRSVINSQSLFLLWSDRFYPIDFGDWATVKTIIILPSNFLVIAPGREIETLKLGNKVKHIFESRKPEVCYSVFADSRWIKSERKINGIRMQTLLYPESQKYSGQIFKTSSKILKFFSETFCRYPFDQFSFITLDSIYARRAFCGFVGYNPAYLKKVFTTTGFDAHETSLIWWGHIIGPSGSGSWQWLEGFGDYAEILYDEKYDQPVPKIFQYFKKKYLSTPNEKDLLYWELRGNTDQSLIHGKYPWLMHLVRFVIGDKNFLRGMKLLFKKFRFKTVTMDEFISALEEGSGKSLKWFREEWLDRKGVPEISFKSGIKKEKGLYKITCRIDQGNNIYHIPVEIGIKTKKGMQTEKVFLTERQMSFSFSSGSAPQKILLDPNNWILMKTAIE